MSKKQRGICKLTGKYGSFVEAHLIPKAVTKGERQGAPLIQLRGDLPPVRRWSSWYDTSLVTAEGERILEDLDTWAIRELRKSKLIWSGWGPMQSLDDHERLGNKHFGVRKIEGLDPTKLRLFFLSLLWRAASTSQPEFSQVEMPPDDLETLRFMILNKDPNPLSFYPTTLTQISTLGPVHNLPPLAQMKTVGNLNDDTPNEIPIFRFYFEGLIAHTHRWRTDNGLTVELGPLVVGGSDALILNTTTYEGSFQREHIEKGLAEALELWPDLMRKL